MIVKLAHLTFAAEKMDVEKMCGRFADHHIQFGEKGLANIPAKERFFQKPHADHDLIKLESEQGVPVEIVGYDRCIGESPAKWCAEKRTLYLFTSDLANSVSFWKRLGFTLVEQSHQEVCLRACFLMDRQPVELRLIPTETVIQALDQRGLVAVAFVVTGLDRWIGKLSSWGVQTSAPQELMVNGHWLEISFASSGSGDIVEFFSIKR